ncbi:ABC transporter permease, partial [Mesorhizobium sp. M7A.F.Ca.CA.004.04.2.1]
LVLFGLTVLLQRLAMPWERAGKETVGKGPWR